MFMFLFERILYLREAYKYISVGTIKRISVGKKKNKTLCRM